MEETPPTRSGRRPPHGLRPRRKELQDLKEEFLFLRPLSEERHSANTHRRPGRTGPTRTQKAGAVPDQHAQKRPWWEPPTRTEKARAVLDQPAHRRPG